MKNYLKAFILAPLTVLFFTGCQQKNDFENINIEQANGSEKPYKIERLSFNELRNDNDFYNVYNTFEFQDPILSSKKSTSFKGEYDTDGFSIDFTSAKRLSNKNSFSYTFLIQKKDQEPNTFENLVIEKDNQGNVNGYIIKYQSDKYWDEGDKEPFKGTVSVSPYAKNINELIKKVSSKNSFSKKTVSRTT